MNAAKFDETPSLAEWLADYILAPDHSFLRPYCHAQAELRSHAAYVLYVRGTYPPALAFGLFSALEAVPEVRAALKGNAAMRIEFLLDIANAATELLREAI